MIMHQIILKLTMRQALYCVNCANVSSQELYEIRSIIIIVSLMQELKHREAE